MSVFTGSEPVTTLSDNFSSLNNLVNDSGIGLCSYAVDTGSTNNYIITLPSPPVSYQSGMIVFFRPVNSNTSASVINVNSLGNVVIKTPAGQPLLSGEIALNKVTGLIFDGTSFRIIPPCPAVLNSTSATSVTLECGGCSSVVVNVSFTASAQNVNLSHLGAGVPVTVSIANSSGGAGSFAILATDPAGTSFTSVNGVLAGGVGALTNLTAAFSIPNGQSRVFTGVSRTGAISFT